MSFANDLSDSVNSPWRRRRFADLVTIKHGFAFLGKHISDKPPGGVLLTPGNFRIGGGFKAEKLKFYDGPIPDDYILPPGTLIVTMTDLSKDLDTLGYPAWSPAFDDAVALHNQRLGLVEPVHTGVDPGFVYYVMCGSDYRNEIIAGASGTTVHHTSPNRILAFEFDLPPIQEQREIAATLGALDDKIESNRRAIELAEDLGDAVFAECANDETPMSEVATLIMGTSPPGTSYNEDGAGVPFYQGVRDFGRRYPSQRVRTIAPVRMAEPNDTLVSVRAPVGKLNRAPEACCVGRGVAAVRSHWPSAIYYALRAASNVWEPFQQEGTVFGAINRADLAGARLLWPPSSQLSNLECRVSALDGRIESLTLETARLTALRDTLLPELLSGRIRVPGAREAVEEAVG